MSGGRELRRHHLVDQRDVRGHVEELRRELDALLSHGQAPFTASRTSTMRPRVPGPAPLTSSSPFTASTAWTVRFRTVVRSWPIRPAIRMPLKTRDGVEEAPIETGFRGLRGEPWLGGTPLKLWRFMTPAVPLPMLVPTTSTFAPGRNTS